MSKAKLLAGAAGLCLVIGTPALAQQAAPAAPQPTPRDCSGLGCLFGTQPASREDARAAETKALQDNQRAAEAAAAEERGAPTGHAKADSSAKDTAASTGKKVATAKSVHIVTIAVAAPETKRLEQLVAALPKEKIKIVRAQGDGARTGADFAVTTTPQPDDHIEQAKLFTEELHIVAGASIKSVADLVGKVVSFGPDKGESQIAARRAFEALHVKVNETPLDVDNALDGLSTGDVAAVVILAPQPADQLRAVSATGIHLVSWPEGGSLPAGASAATINADAYPTLTKPGEKIRAVGIEATLVISPKGARQGAAKSFLKSLSQHADALTKRGFDLLKADLDTRGGRRMASADKS